MNMNFEQNIHAARERVAHLGELAAENFSLRGAARLMGKKNATRLAIAGLRVVTALGAIGGAQGVLNAPSINHGGEGAGIANIAEASPLSSLKDPVLFDSEVMGNRPYAILERWPELATTTRTGILNQAPNGIGLEKFFSADGSPLPELHWLQMRDVPRNANGEFMIPDNTGFTLNDIALRGDGRTQPIFIRVNPNKILFVSAGEGQMIWFASRFSMDNGARDAVVNWPQIDAEAGQLANPVNHLAWFRTGEDPVIALQGFVKDHAVLIQYDDPRGSVAEDQLIGQAQLSRSTKASYFEAYDMQTGAWGHWRALHGPKAANDQERRNFDPRTYFTRKAGNVS